MVPAQLDQCCSAALRRTTTRDVRVWIPVYAQNGSQPAPDTRHNTTTGAANAPFMQIFKDQKDRRGSFVSVLNRNRNMPIKISNVASSMLPSSHVMPLS